MKTITKQSLKYRSLVTGLAVFAALWAMPGIAHGQIIYVCEGNNTVGEYDAMTGAAINPSFITGVASPYNVAVSGGKLYVDSPFGTIGVYGLATGAPINPSLVSGLSNNRDVVVSGGNLYVAVVNAGTNGSGVIGEYDATTGAPINPSLVTGLSAPSGLALYGGNQSEPSTSLFTAALPTQAQTSELIAVSTYTI